ncbi:hypothetical protein D9619_011519 [Psilocybe cf. subviscida]|uniref:Guided entry of tail-anchored proteins 1 n=1 Tax=Psilocybe cf. subviscida TaxID=2480587 RepID=A0A8H5BSD2_9AGAR|nr:hypothetical protein D9619_011519 [Psilocybe cf. subviscida]
MSPLLTIFLLVFIGQLVTWIGKTVLLDIVYDAYLRLTRSPLAAKQRALKSEILSTKAELMKTSAQDQFAKWAKLRRSVDKGLADLEKLNSQIASTKSGFGFKFNTLLWIMTTGLQFVVGWWYRKQAVFFLPPGWFGPLGWWLALPFAPAALVLRSYYELVSPTLACSGSESSAPPTLLDCSVSVGVWQMACRRVILVGERVVKDFIQVNGSSSSPEDSDVSANASSASTPNNTPQKKTKAS